MAALREYKSFLQFTSLAYHMCFVFYVGNTQIWLIFGFALPVLHLICII